MSTILSIRNSRLIKDRIPPFDRRAWAMLGGIFVGSIGTHIIGSFLALFLTLHIGLSPSIASIVLATFALTIMGGQIIVAPFASRWGRKTAFIVSLLSESFAALLIFLLPGAGWTIVGILLIGLSWGAEQIAGSSLLAELVEESTQTEVFAWQRAMFNLAAAIGAPLGGLMFARSAPFIILIDCVATFLFAIIIATLVKTSSEPVETSPSHSPRSLYKTVLSDRAFVIFCLMMVLIWMGNSQTTTILPMFLSSVRGFSPQTLGWMMGTLGVMAVIGQLIIGRAFRNVGPNRMVVLGTIAITIGFAGFALFEGVFGVTGALLVLSIGSLILFPAASALTASRSSTNLRPAYFAVYGLSYSTGIFLGPILGGSILQQWPNSAVWVVFALLIGSSGLIYWTIGTYKERSVSMASSD